LYVLLAKNVYVAHLALSTATYEATQKRNERSEGKGDIITKWLMKPLLAFEL